MALKEDMEDLWILAIY